MGARRPGRLAAVAFGFAMALLASACGDNAPGDEPVAAQAAPRPRVVEASVLEAAWKADPSTLRWQDLPGVEGFTEDLPPEVRHAALAAAAATPCPCGCSGHTLAWCLHEVAEGCLTARALSEELVQQVIRHAAERAPKRDAAPDGGSADEEPGLPSERVQEESETPPGGSEEEPTPGGPLEASPDHQTPAQEPGAEGEERATT